jgi:hypothetical protein
LAQLENTVICQRHRNPNGCFRVNHSYQIAHKYSKLTFCITDQHSLLIFHRASYVDMKEYHRQKFSITFTKFSFYRCTRIFKKDKNEPGTNSTYAIAKDQPVGLVQTFTHNKTSQQNGKVSTDDGGNKLTRPTKKDIIPTTVFKIPITSIWPGSFHYRSSNSRHHTGPNTCIQDTS